MDRAFINNVEKGISLLTKQIQTVTPYIITPSIEELLYDKFKYNVAEKIYECLNVSSVKQAYDCDNNPSFNFYHHGQYAMFLLILGNSIYNSGSLTELVDVIDYVNYAVNNLFITCKMEIPEIFYLDHPIGTVIGRAKLGKYFYCPQNCTIGANRGNGENLDFPTLGDHVIMCANSSLFGKTVIGNNVVIASNTSIVNKTIPSNCLVFQRMGGVARI